MNQLPDGVTPDMLLEVEFKSGYSALVIASKVDWQIVKRFRVYAG